MRAAGLTTLRSYRQSGVTARLTIGCSILVLLILATALVSLSLGPVNIPFSHVAAIVLSFLGLDLADFRAHRAAGHRADQASQDRGGSLGRRSSGSRRCDDAGAVSQPDGRPRDYRRFSRRGSRRGRGHRHGNGGALLPRTPDLRVRGRHGLHIPGLRHSRRRWTLLHGYPCYSRASRSTPFSAQSSQRSSSPCPVTRRFERSCSGSRGAWTPVPGST